MRPAPSREITWLGAIALAALGYRVLGLSQPHLELDSAVYLRAILDYSRSFATGEWHPPTSEHYTALEYWPPLFPLLAGLVDAVLGDNLRSALAVTVGCGWLSLFPAWLLARRFWGPAAGLWAAFLVGFDPFLSWYSRVPRTEALYLLLIFGAWAGAGWAWRAGPRAWLAGAASGACFGLSFATRFGTPLMMVPWLLGLASLALAQPGPARRRIAAMAAAGLVTFAATAAPYLGYLAWLNGGELTLISPAKEIYDTTEGMWAMEGRSMGEFILRYGPPGLVGLDPDDPGVREAFQGRLERSLDDLVAEGVAGVPRGLAAAAANWTPLLAALALGAALRFRKEPAVGALLWMYLPVPVFGVLTWWDPNTRYYAFTLFPTVLLAARGLAALEEVELPRGPAVAAVLLLVMAGGWIPGRVHFDVRAPLDPDLFSVIADPAAWKLRILGAGAAAALLALLRPTRLLGGLLGSLAALRALAVSARWDEAWDVEPLGVAAALGLLAAFPALMLATAPRESRSGGAASRDDQKGAMERAVENPRDGASNGSSAPSQEDRGGRSLAHWIGGWTVAGALLFTFSQGLADRALARLSFSDDVAEVLRRDPGRSALSSQAIDPLRAGKIWRPSPLAGPSLEIGQGGPPDLIVLFREEHGIHLAGPRFDLAGARYDLVRVVPIPSRPRHERQWRVYRLASGSIGPVGPLPPGAQVGEPPP